MLRRLFTILSAVSLLLCVALCVLWVRSYGNGDTFAKFGPTGVEVTSRTGVVSVWSYRGFPIDLPFRWERGGQSVRHWGAVPGYEYSGEGVYSGQQAARPLGGPVEGHTDYRPSAGGPPVRVTWTAWWFPHWSSAVALAVGPAAWLVSHIRRRRRHRRSAAGLCPGCGYDLRATPDRCPECGVVPIKSPILT